MRTVLATINYLDDVEIIWHPTADCPKDKTRSFVLDNFVPHPGWEFFIEDDGVVKHQKVLS